jgi:hypothetical protein
MPFQFLCPQGHLLQAELSQVGRQCRCPFCQTVCLVPWPYNPAPPPLPPAMEKETGSILRDFPGGGQGPVGLFRLKTPQPFSDPLVYQLPLVHIPCPAGHVLETPCEMLSQKAICPFCHAQFDLELENSLEYKKQIAEQEDHRQQLHGRIWLYGAIAAAALFLMLLFLLTRGK